MSVVAHTSSSLVSAEPFVLGSQRKRARAHLENSTTNSLRLDTLASFLSGTTTHASVEAERVTSSRHQENVLDRIKHASGLTWEQIARLMGVQRRSIHNWLNGSTISADHEERLHALEAVVEVASSERSPHETRAWMRNRSRGASIVDLFEAGMVAEALAAVSRQPASVAFHARPISGAGSVEMGPFSALDLLETPAPIELPARRVKRVVRVRRPRPDERN